MPVLGGVSKSVRCVGGVTITPPPNPGSAAVCSCSGAVNGDRDKRSTADKLYVKLAYGRLDTRKNFYTVRATQFWNVITKWFKSPKWLETLRYPWSCYIGIGGYWPESDTRNSKNNDNSGCSSPWSYMALKNQLQSKQVRISKYILKVKGKKGRRGSLLM